LRQFIAYKSLATGVPVVFVDPAYTSQTCHRCGERGHRNGVLFSCTTCGVFDADLNGALNIAARGAKVIQPEHPDASIPEAAPG
jgi:transposase